MISPPIEPPAPDRPTNAERKARLSARTARVRGRLRRLTLAEGGLWILGAIAAFLALGLLLDWWFGLPRWVRVLVLVINLGTAAGVAWRRLLVPLRHIPDHDALALLIERGEPSLRSRLISAIQLGREARGTAEAEAFVRRLENEVDAATARLETRRVAPADALRQCARRTVPVLGALAIGLFLGAPNSWVLLRRAVLEELPRPTRTRVVEVTGAKVVGRGDDLLLSARVEGVIPKTARLQLRHESGRIQNLVIEAEPTNPGRFERLLVNLPASFRYRFRINDATSEEFAVTVLPRPVVTNLALVQVLPAYTGLEPRRLEPGELTLVRGSRLQVEARSSLPLKEASARLTGLERSVPATLDPSDPTRLSFELPITDPGLKGFALQLTDEHGISSRDPATYEIEVVPDRPPQVRMILPSRREELVTTRGTVLVAFEVRDDFGLAALRLRHQPAGRSNAAPATIDLDLSGETSATADARRRFEWKLASMNPPLAEGVFQEFWIEAIDGNDVDGPGVGRGEPYLLRVVSEAEKRSDLLTRAGDAIGRLGDVAQGQDRLNESLGRIILSKPSGGGTER